MSVTDKSPTIGNGHVGRALKRKEDPRLITGQATYVDDVTLPVRRAPLGEGDLWP